MYSLQPHDILVILFHLLVLNYVSATTTFEDYPLCPQTWLLGIAAKDCDDGKQWDYEQHDDSECICTNTTWLVDMATEIYNKCNCDDLNASVNQLLSDCSRQNYHCPWTPSDFMMFGVGSNSPCTATSIITTMPPSGTTYASPAATTMSTSTTNAATASPSDPSSQRGIILQEQSNRIALGVGISFGIAGIIVTILFSTCFYNFFKGRGFVLRY